MARGTARTYRFNLFAATLAALALALVGTQAQAASRLELIQRRGFVVCGVSPGVTGFAQVDGQGRYSGLDVDICRALSAAIFGVPDKVKYVAAASVEFFLRSSEIDVVSRRLTWSLRRDGLGLLFGPVTFYDGQGFLVPSHSARMDVRQLSGARICVVPGTLMELNLNAWFREHGLTFQKVPIAQTTQLTAALAAGRCEAATADVSELGSLRSSMPAAGNFDILAEQISREPLAQLVRADDVRFFNVLRWTVFALINAEELGVTSANLAAMLKSDDSDVKRLLGVIPGNGRALGLDERWAYHIIAGVGNYGEVYERNVGMGSRVRLPRGLNRLSTSGGLLFAPPLR